MPYKVHKLIEDRRNNTCGFFIPNGGFYHVIEMTFENHQQLWNIGQRVGYSVDLVEGTPGFFDGEGFEVDISTVEVHPISKVVISYEKVAQKDHEGRQSAKASDHKETERAAVVQQAKMFGIDGRLSTQEIKRRIEEMSRKPQSSLVAG